MISLEDFLEQDRFTHLEIKALIVQLTKSSVEIQKTIRRNTLMHERNDLESVNASGEKQKKLDVIANELITENVKDNKALHHMISEELKQPIYLNPDSEYCLAIDPLDGSSNTTCNLPLGTIFGIYYIDSNQNQIHNTIYAGKNQVAAGYMLYSNTLQFVYTTRKGVNLFTYQEEEEQFLLTKQKLTFPYALNIYSINEAYWNEFTESVKRYLTGLRSTKITSRYVGALVADFHRNLLQGGIYMYPSTEKHPTGKLRLLYECNPLALIAQEANGRASNGLEDILMIQTKNLHETTPLFIGEKNNIKNMIDTLKT